MVYYIWNLTLQLCKLDCSLYHPLLFPLPLSPSLKFMDACISLVLYSPFFPHARRMGLIDFVNAAGVFFVKFMLIYLDRQT